MYYLELKNMFKEKILVVLGIGGISCSMLLIIVLKGVLLGTVAMAGDFSRNVGADIFITQKGVSNMMAGSSTINKNIKYRLKEIEKIKEVYPIYGSLYSFKIENKQIAALLIGYDINHDMGKPWKIKEGRNIESSKEVVIDKSIANNNSIKLGDTILLSGNEYEVVGFSDETNAMGAQYIFISIEEAEKNLCGETYYNYYLLTVKEGYDSKDIVNNIENSIKEVDAYTKDEFAKKNENCLYEILKSPINMMTYIGVFIAIIISGMSIYTVTNLKMGEYSVLRTVGASNKKMIATIILQTLIINLFGFLIATLLSIVIKIIFNDLGLAMSLILTKSVFLFTGVVILLTCISTIYFPIRRITKVDPASVFLK